MTCRTVTLVATDVMVVRTCRTVTLVATGVMVVRALQTTTVINPPTIHLPTSTRIQKVYSSTQVMNSVQHGDMDIPPPKILTFLQTRHHTLTHHKTMSLPPPVISPVMTLPATIRMDPPLDSTTTPLVIVAVIVTLWQLKRSKGQCPSMHTTGYVVIIMATSSKVQTH